MVTPSVLQSVVAAEAPTPFEKEAYVRTFLDHYLNYDQHTLPKNWADALNMMTAICAERLFCKCRPTMR